MYETYETGEHIRQLAAEILPASISAHPSGLAYLSGAWLDENILSQTHALLFSAATIGFVLVFLLRSWRAGAWGMLPNLLPLCVVGGVLGYANPIVDSDLIIVALVAIGIAVDDTIHFLARAQVEATRATDVADSVSRTFDAAGRGIAKTTLIFAVGILPLATADYLPLRWMGVFLPLAMVAALVADLFLLPALIHVGWLPLPVRRSESHER